MRLVAAEARRAPGVVSLTVVLSLLTSGLSLAAAGVAAAALQSLLSGESPPGVSFTITGAAGVAGAGVAVFSLFLLAAVAGYAARAVVVRAMRAAFERLMRDAAAAVKARIGVPGGGLPASLSTAAVLNADCRYAAMTFAAALNALPGLVTALAGCVALAVVDARVLVLVIVCAALAAPVQIAAARRADSATRDLLSASGPSTRARAGLMRSMTAGDPNGAGAQQARLAAEIASGETRRFLDAMERRQMVTERAEFIALVARGLFATVFVVGLGALAAVGEVDGGAILFLLIIGGVTMASLGAAGGAMVYAAALTPLFAPLARLLHGRGEGGAALEPDARLAGAPVCAIFTAAQLDWFLAATVAARTAPRGARTLIATGFEPDEAERGAWAEAAADWRARLSERLSAHRLTWLDALCARAGGETEGPAERVLARVLMLSPRDGDAVIVDGSGYARLSPDEKRILNEQARPAAVRLVFKNTPTHAGVPDDAPLALLLPDDTLDVRGEGRDYRTIRHALSQALSGPGTPQTDADLL